MAEPLKIVRRLNDVTTDYAVFERDQVLTETQLNSVTEYFDDQARLTRTQLLGVGIIGGLWPTWRKEVLVVGKGVGVTSDGDLLGYADDTVFDRWIDYDESAPAYDPFHLEDKRLPLIELLRREDKRDGKPLADLANTLPAMIAIAFMESYENDPDLCTGGDCDNKGRMALNKQRLLLVDREMGQKIGLAARLGTGADLARQLPRMRASRVDLGTGNDAKVDVTSAEKFAARYRNAAGASLKALQAGVARLAVLVGDGSAAGLPDPTAWAGLLEKRLGALGGVVGGVQYWHAHAKDLIAVWNALREALFADDSVLCPSAGAFPKHLLLGVLADPAVDRTGCYPAPWLAGGKAERQRVVALMRRFDTLLKAFAQPTDTLTKITPSRREVAALELRAVPIYYRASPALREAWNETRRLRGETEDTPGYFWTPDPSKGDPADPFITDQGTTDFYRIEGFLGLKADIAEVAIEKLIRQRNLPIAVMSALAHNERKWIIRGPLFKNTSLHSLHYLLRQDVASQIRDNIAYSDLLVKRFDVDKAWVPASSGKATPTDTVAAAKQELVKADSALIGEGKPLSVRSFKSFQPVAATWTAPLNAAVLNTAKARTSIGDIVRTDIISPVDTLSASKSHIWVGWLGDILKKREEEHKEKLLLTNLLNEHPGLEHAGGCVPGGTFVLVYNDAGIVIGDLMLPYWIDDNDESDFEEPELIFPDIRTRLPDDLQPIRVIKPLQLDLAEFKAREIAPEINIQTNYARFFKDSLGTLGDVLKNTKVNVVTDVAAGSKAATNDRYLAALLGNVEYQKVQLQNMKEIQNDESLPQPVRDKAAEQAKLVEVQLADSVGQTVQYFAVDASETVRFEADKSAVYDTVGSAISLVSDQQASTKLQTNLNVTSEAATKLTTGSSAMVVNQVMVNAGMKLR